MMRREKTIFGINRFASWWISLNLLVDSSSVSYRSFSCFSTIARDDLHSLSSLSLEAYLKLYQNKQVLVVGDGDFSFSRDLSSFKVCSELTTSTIDSQDSLIKHFPTAYSNIQEIARHGDRICYETDATNLQFERQSFDIITWHFPHVQGKQNIRYNRQLVSSFLQSASKLLREDGILFLALCEKQSGVVSWCKKDWDYSWKLPELLLESRLLLTKQYDFEQIEWPSYRPTGRRGLSKNFNAGPLRLYQLEKVTKGVTALQSPIFTLEVPLLSPTIIIKPQELIDQVSQAVPKVLQRYGWDRLFWSVLIVDFFSGRETDQYLYTVEIGITSLHQSFTRELVDDIRKVLQVELPPELSMGTNTKIGYQHVSKAMPWFIALELQKRYQEKLSMAASMEVIRNLQQLESLSLNDKQLRKEVSHRIAQYLWKDRAGFLLQQS